MKNRGDLFLGAIAALLIMIQLQAGGDTEAGVTAPTLGSLGGAAVAGKGCLPTDEENFFTSGWEVVTNDAPTPLTITDVSVTDPHGVEVTDSRVLTINPDTTALIGNVVGHDYTRSTQRSLDRSRPAAGATLAPGESVNVILFLESRGGNIGPVRISYDDSSGNHHLWTGGTWWSFMPNCHKNDGWPQAG